MSQEASVKTGTGSAHLLPTLPRSLPPFSGFNNAHLGRIVSFVLSSPLDPQGTRNSTKERVRLCPPTHLTSCAHSRHHRIEVDVAEAEQFATAGKIRRVVQLRILDDANVTRNFVSKLIRHAPGLLKKQFFWVVIISFWFFVSLKNQK